ncbi:hypothetical protein HHL16_17055 [Pseudoflavitalea sp. G-6-1-2]|uniref:hypothetical protein n=1 Tax=Pseudoflavitalea sp. G-6-1-2 TaxID=2728841 RepID=UPI00146F4697|nr:hypothetical protein [Pseudoflavitalea sp. G-6-1-2]NML22594.1 hypothetical protein [Pseudoflavitalea sp. G-6-1-2]
MIQPHMRMRGIAAVMLAAIFMSSAACSKSKDEPKEEPLPEGTILVNEKFDGTNSEVWATAVKGPVTYSIKDGWYSADIAIADTYVTGAWATKTYFQKGDKQNVEVIQKKTAGHEYDKAGLTFWFVNTKNYLSFQIGDKAFRVLQRLNDVESNLITWTNSAAIKGNIGEQNKLKISLADAKILFYINDVHVATMNAGPVETLDKIGLRIDKLDFTPHSTYLYDNLRMWKSK